MKYLISGISLLLIWANFQPSLYAQGGLEERISELSTQIDKEMTSHQKKTIAVIEFSDLEGNVNNFGRFISEELITRLYQTKKFKVIERQLLNKVMAEHKLSMTGIIDAASAKELGRILGVDAICSGTITNLAQSLRVNARIIDTETGEIFAVASTSIFKDESVIGLMSSGAAGSRKEGVAPSSARPTAKKAGASSVQKVEANGFTFELVECKMLGTTVICDVLITNNSEDRELGLFSGEGGPYGGSASRIFDEAGNEYGAQEYQLGVKKGKGYGWVLSLVVHGIPTRASFTFEKISLEATIITLLEIGARSGTGRGENFRAQIRNILISK